MSRLGRRGAPCVILPLGADYEVTPLLSWSLSLQKVLVLVLVPGSIVLVNIIDCNSKKDCAILIIFGTNIFPMILIQTHLQYAICVLLFSACPNCRLWAASRQTSATSQLLIGERASDVTVTWPRWWRHQRAPAGPGRCWDVSKAWLQRELSSCRRSVLH